VMMVRFLREGRHDKCEHQQQRLHAGRPRTA
jgi:hypothetical protein